MDTSPRSAAIEHAVLACDAFSEIGSPYRKSAAYIASLLSYIDATDTQAIAFAVDLADLMSGGSAIVYHDIGSRSITVEDDDDAFTVIIGGAPLIWFQMAGVEFSDLIANFVLLEKMKTQTPA